MEGSAQSGMENYGWKVGFLLVIFWVQTLLIRSKWSIPSDQYVSIFLVSNMYNGNIGTNDYDYD